MLTKAKLNQKLRDQIGYVVNPDGYGFHMLDVEEFDRYLEDPIVWMTGHYTCKPEEVLEYFALYQNQQRCQCISKTASGKQCKNFDGRYFCGFGEWLSLKLEGDFPLCQNHKKP